MDRKDIDYLGRRKTRVIAIDALCRPGKKQYGSEFLLRYIILFQNRRILILDTFSVCLNCPITPYTTYSYVSISAMAYSCLFCREVNKAFTGFFDQCKYQQYEEFFQDSVFLESKTDKDIKKTFSNDAPVSFSASPLLALNYLQEKQINIHLDFYKNINVRVSIVYVLNLL